MQIIKDELYKSNLQIVLKYVAKDSKAKASKFNKQLFMEVSKLVHMPYKFRQSHYYKDENIRDFIFKGYTIPYLVNVDKEVIVVLDIFKWSQR